MSDEEREMEEDPVDAEDEEVQDEDDGLGKYLKKPFKKFKQLIPSCTKPDVADEDDPSPNHDGAYSIQKQDQDEHSQGTTASDQKTVQESDTVYNYNMEHTKRGHAVFVCNEFKGTDDQRNGAQEDMGNLRNVFVKRLGFKQVNAGKDHDLTTSDMKEVLKDVVKNHTDCDCFVFAISSHGEELVNPNKNGELDAAVKFVTPDKNGEPSTGKVENSEYMMFLTEIIGTFSDKNCEKLAGKPKIFLFQCCRSRRLAPDDMKPDSPEVQNLWWTFFQFGCTKDGIITDVLAKTSPLNNHHVLRKLLQTLFKQNLGKTPVKFGDFYKVLKEFKLEEAADAMDDGVYMQLIKDSDKSTGYGGPSHSTAEHSQADASGFSGVEPEVVGDSVDAGHKADTTPPPLAPSPDIITDGNMAYCFHDDCLVMAAVAPKKFAWRSQKVGSWMIHYLNEAMKEQEKGQTVHFLQLLARTSQLMAERETFVPKIGYGGYLYDKKGTIIEDKTKSRKKAVPMIEHTLTQNIVFKKKFTGN